MTPRLIERWLPIAELGEESIRERRSMTALPPTYYLHVWWARRPLVASRAAVLASLLPADADREKFLHVIGIHGDPVAARRRIDRAKRTGVRFEGEAYGYPRAFDWSPSEAEREWISEELQRGAGTAPTVLDPTAGGGSIPFESARLGLPTLANDLNPVAALLLRATVLYPNHLGAEVLARFRELADRFTTLREERLASHFPQEPIANSVPTNYLWARTIRCPYCDGLIPLSPNWRLNPGGKGVRLTPDAVERVCTFEIVDKASEQSEGTVTGGNARCPYPECGRVVDGDEVKRQAQAGGMGEQLYAVVYKRRVEVPTKSGKKKRVKWVRGYRAPEPSDDNSAAIRERLAEKMLEWEAMDVVPSEAFPPDSNDDRPIQYGMPLWRDLFSPRQLLCHGTSVELFREIADSAEDTEVDRAALGYLAIAMDTLLNYGNRSCRWDTVTERVRSIFDRHDFAFVSSYAEMAPLVTGLGFDWTIEKTAKCIEELIELSRPDLARRAGKGATLFDEPRTPPPVTVTCGSADSLSHLADGSVDAVVMDPPYYDNVMYAELSDFFYVWLKRTAGRVFPELFRRHLTDKDNEAVANPAKFAGQKGAKALAGRDYQQRMAGIFAECRRVLKDDGILTLMFTHKATGAWDALASGLIEAGFTITTSWPVNTESEGSLHIKDKSAANSTIILACRPRATRAEGEVAYWEEVEPEVVRAVRSRIEEYRKAGIFGVDLYLSCFGPALEKFAEHWPLRRGQPRRTVEVPKGRQRKLLAEPVDPYAVTPSDALDAARREVKRWRLDTLLRTQRQTQLDPLTEWFVLAWDAFRAPEFPYDEGLHLARVVGVDLDRDVVGRIAEKKASNLRLWDSSRRAAKGALGAADGSRGALDALHHAAHRARQQSASAAQDLLVQNGLHTDATFTAALAAVLEVLPVPASFGREGGALEAEGASADFEALEKLRKLVFGDRLPEPEQLRLAYEEPA